MKIAVTQSTRPVRRTAAGYDPSMEERPVSHRSYEVIDADEDDLLRQWKKWRRAAALSRRRRSARRAAAPTSPTCACGGRRRRVPKPKPGFSSTGEERVDVTGGGGGLAPVLPPAAWHPYDLRCTECDGETCWRRRKPACWAADWKAPGPRQRWRPYPSFADVAAALGDLRLDSGDADHSGDVDMIASSLTIS